MLLPVTYIMISMKLTTPVTLSTSLIFSFHCLHSFTYCILCYSVPIHCSTTVLQWLVLTVPLWQIGGLLERCACQLEELISADITLDVTGTPDSFCHKPDSKPISVSSRIARRLVCLCSATRKAHQSKQLVVWPGLSHLSRLQNSFQPSLALLYPTDPG